MNANATQIATTGQDAIEILINDHQVIKGLLQQLCDATQSSARTSTLEQLKGILTIHNATEENLVYPALREVAGKKAESLHLYNETAEADVMLFKLDTMLKLRDDTNFQTAAKEFQAAILEHIDDEEEKAFPHLKDRSEPAQSQLLTQAVRELRTALRFTTPTKSETGEIERP